MKIKEAIEEGKNVLSKNNIEDNVIITRELLAFVLGVEKQYLVIHLEDELNAEDYIKFKETEIKNIIMTIEGIRYGLEPEEIKSYLIGMPDSRE